MFHVGFLLHASFFLTTLAERDELASKCQSDLENHGSIFRCFGTSLNWTVQAAKLTESQVPDSFSYH